MKKFIHVKIHLYWEYIVLSVHGLAFANVQMKLQYLAEKDRLNAMKIVLGLGAIWNQALYRIEISASQYGEIFVEEK